MLTTKLKKRRSWEEANKNVWTCFKSEENKVDRSQRKNRNNSGRSEIPSVGRIKSFEYLEVTTASKNKEIIEIEQRMLKGSRALERRMI